MLGLSNLIMGILNSAEVVIILIIAVALIFGARKIPDIANSLVRYLQSMKSLESKQKRRLKQLEILIVTTTTLAEKGLKQ